MFVALSRTLAQLPTPPFQRVLLLSLLGSVATAIVLWFIVDLALINTDFVGIGWLDSITDILGSVAAIVLLVLLFPAFVGVFAGFMVETVCRAVEARYYPQLPEARQQSILEAALTGLRFGALLIVANLLVLPLYLIPLVNIFVYWVLNGYLLGREYFELVAYRRLDPAQTKALRRRNRLQMFAGGLVLAAIALVPIVNLFLPLIGTALLLHIFETIRTRGESA